MFSLKKLFGDENKKALKALDPVVAKINSFEGNISTLSDEALKGKTIEFKERLNPPAGGGETLDDLLPEAYAVVREAAKRNLEQRHFDVQLIGGIISST